MKTKPIINILKLIPKSRFIIMKNVSLVRIKSTINHTKEIIIPIVKGMHKILKLNDSNKLPFINSSVALPIPQPGQGIPVTDLNKQSDL